MQRYLSETLGMDTPQREHRPGDLILDRYMPNASDAEREEARENLRRFACVLTRIEDRLALEWYEQQIRKESAVEFESESHPPKL